MQMFVLEQKSRKLNRYLLFHKYKEYVTTQNVLSGRVALPVTVSLYNLTWFFALDSSGGGWF
jgi:hypothetical protein